MYVGIHERPFVPDGIPFSMINALPLSQCSEQTEANKRGLLDLQRHKSIERQWREVGVGGNASMCMCMRTASRQRGRKQTPCTLTTYYEALCRDVK